MSVFRADIRPGEHLPNRHKDETMSTKCEKIDTYPYQCTCEKEQCRQFEIDFLEVSGENLRLQAELAECLPWLEALIDFHQNDFIVLDSSDPESDDSLQGLERLITKLGAAK